MQVPCSRCVTKQIVCQSRATRRSSHNPNRRNGMPRPHPERALTTSTGSFHVSQLSHFSAPTPDVPMISPSECPQPPTAVPVLNRSSTTQPTASYTASAAHSNAVRFSSNEYVRYSLRPRTNSTSPIQFWRDGPSCNEKRLHPDATRLDRSHNTNDAQHVADGSFHSC